MEAKSSKKINYLAYLNLGIGFFSFLVGLVPMILLMTTMTSLLKAWDINIPDSLGDMLFDLIRNPIFFRGACIGIFLSFFTQWIGLIATISIDNKFHRGVAFLGNLFGTFGLIGNLLTLLIVFLSSLSI